FLAFFFWAMYRKLWLWAAVNLIGGIVLALTVRPGFVYLAWALFWPLSANYLYFRHARRCVRARIDDDNDDDATTPIDALRAGGVSRAAVGVGMMVIFLVSAGLNNVLQNQLLERYSERIGAATPGPGSQQRGDGSVIENLETIEPQVAKTAAALGALSVAFRLSLDDAAAGDGDDALGAALLDFAQRRVRDSWGNAIAVNRDADRIALVSAGPDGRFGSDDDILQYIPLNRL
ncbi:MAG: hypothetical protein ACR2P7_08055, partial [bacterium]